MKKIMLIAATILLAACSKQPPLLFPKFDGAKGNILYVQYSIEYMKDSMPTIDEYRLSFDKDGNRIEKKSDDGYIKWAYKDGVLVKEEKSYVSYWEGKELRFIELFEKRGSKYIYHHFRANWKGVEELVEDSITVIERKNNLTIRESYDTNTPEDKYVITMDKNGNMIEEIYMYDSGKRNDKYSYKYKKNNILSVFLEITERGEFIHSFSGKFKHSEKDRKGNWTKREYYSADNELINTATRKISYLD